jgi:8-oxo-dGTP pyrophosphatase MutT (NUDIX family)
MKSAGSANDALRKLLEAHAPRDRIESGFARRMLELAKKGEGASSREHFEPGHFTATCLIVYPPSKAVLLHFHKRLQLWLPMGGHMEAGEEPGRAALREGAEESGLADLKLLSPAPISLDIHPIPAARGEPLHEHFDIRFAAVTDAPQTIRMDANESDELEWFELDEAESKVHDPRSFARLRELL